MSTLQRGNKVHTCIYVHVHTHTFIYIHRWMDKIPGINAMVKRTEIEQGREFQG